MALKTLAGLQESLALSSFAQGLLCCPSGGSRLCPRDRDCRSDAGPSSLQLHVKVDSSCRAILACLAQSQPGEGSHYQELETAHDKLEARCIKYEELISELYQVCGSLLDDAGAIDRPEAQLLLNELHTPTGRSLLPWPAFKG